MKTTPAQKSPVLLYIDASPRGARSKSRQLGRDYLESWATSHHGARIITRDLAIEPPPFVSEAWVEGAYAPLEQQSPAARQAMSVSDAYVDELLAADQVVITTPVYNFSVPAALKAWIDQIVRAGRTFGRTAAGLEGLVKDKRVLVIVASGGDLRLDTPGGAFNFVEPYLRGVLGFIGITDVQFVYAHSSGDAVAGPAAVASAQATLTQLAAA